MTKQKKTRAPISQQLPKDIADFVPGPGISKREYGLSKTAREKWIIKEVDRIIFYLRIRSNFDGVREFIPHQEYKNPFIRQCLKLLVKQGNGNYWGVIIFRDKFIDGMVGDSLYGEFWNEYHEKASLGEWLETPGKFRKLFKKYKAMYKIRGAQHRMEAKIKQLEELPHLYQAITARRSKRDKGGAREVEDDPFLHWKDHLYLARQLTAEKHFKWTKKSHRRTKRKAKRDEEMKKSRTRQSLWSLMELMKYNVLIDERYNMQLLANNKDQNDRDYLYIWDHELKREHIFARLGSNKMDSQISVWNSVMEGIDKTRHFQNKVYTENKDKMPTLPPFMLGDKWHQYKYELDFREGGGWVDVGAHNRDSVPVHLGDEPAIVMQGEYVLTTACVTNFFGNGCNTRGAKVLSLIMAWSHQMRHNHNLTGGKHYTNRDGEELSPKEKEALYKSILENDDLL